MICGYGRRRENEGKNAPPSLLRFDVHLSVVTTDNLAHEVEPQPQRHLSVCGLLPEALEWLKQPIQVVLAEAGPAVGHRKAHLRLGLLDLHIDRLAAGRVLERVVHNVLHGLQESHLVPNDHGVVGKLGPAKRLILVLGVGLEAFDHLLGQGRNVDRRERKIIGKDRRGGKVQIVKVTGGLLRRRVDQLNFALGITGELLIVLKQNVGQTLDGQNGVLQLVQYGGELSRIVAHRTP